MKKLLQLLLLFKVTIILAQTPIQEFNFNSSVANAAGTATFTVSGTPFSYVPDRNGVANGAINLNGQIGTANGGHLNANLTNLPTGNAARSISFWLRCSSFNENPIIYPFAYGTQGANQSFGVQQNTSVSSANPNRIEIYGFGPAANNIGTPAPAIQVNQWYHYVVTHDGINTTKIYRNNVLLATITKTWATVGTNVTLGRIIVGSYSDMYAYNGALDDLKIYDVALTDAQVSNLYAPATLPVISNTSVTAVGNNTATINYSANSFGQNAERKVTYTFGTSNPISTVPVAFNSNSATAYSTNLTGLPQNRRIAANVLAQVVGQIDFAVSPQIIFTTTGNLPVPTVSGVNILNVTATSVDLNYLFNPNGTSPSTANIQYVAGNTSTAINGAFQVTGTSNVSYTSTLSGLMPNTTYNYVIFGSNAFGESQDISGTFTTAGNQPVLTNVNTSNITSTGATVDYSLNANGLPTSTFIYYGLTPTSISNSISGSISSSTVATPFSVNFPVLNSNTTYYYYVQSGSTGGSATSDVYSFTTLAAPSIPNPVYNFEFNNNLQSQDGSVTLNDPIFGTTAFSYVSNGTVSNGAIQINDARSQTQLPNLPQGASNRSVHVRLRFASGALSTENFIFNWGTGATGQAFAYHQTATTAKLLGWGGAGYDYASIPSSGANFGQWYEYVFTYNGTTMSVYRDGTLLGTSNATLNTSGDVFRIGVSNSGIQKLQADIDYIRVFNQALTGAQVSQIYSNPNLLSNTNFSANNLEFNLYPNPASDILNIESENELKSVEIYSLQGQKVMSSKNNVINISDLASGLYLVQVTDIENITATKKLVIK